MPRHAPLAEDWSPTASHFLLSGVPQSFGSLPPAQLPARPDLSQFDEIAGTSAQPAQWNRVAHLVEQPSALHVAVLGCSTTVGCGSADPSSLCDASRAWPRLFHDALRSQMQRDGWSIGVQTNVHAKNAVDPTYFAQCTTSFVGEDTHVVLVEFFSNLFGLFKQGNHTGLDATIEAIRESAPNAAVIFVVWLKETTGRTAGHLRSFIPAVAARQSADVLDVPLLMTQVASKKQAPVAAWYAKGGHDHHPNGAGHWLIANAAARLVARRLASATPARAPSDARTAVQASTLYCDGCAKKNITKRQVCYNTAAELPVRKPLKGSWQLVDEGGDKGVAKLGFVSTRVGDTMEFNLGVLCAGDGTGSAGVRLGYHMSTRPGQGALQLRCRGCTCRALTGIMSSVSPFPLAQTDVKLVDARYFSLPGHLNGSLSITASTTFGIQPSAQRDECIVSVEHVRSRTPRSERSRVRIDSLATLQKCPPARVARFSS